jgi:glycosyltransferase involved in cell wall biosynthesis
MSEPQPVAESRPFSVSEKPSYPPGKSLTVAIPALNEEKNIESAIRAALETGAKVPELRLEIIVIDDGSRDRTAEIVRGISQQHDNVRMIQNPENIGLGASIRRAIEAAGMEKFLFIPGDNDIPASTLDLLFRNAYAADVVMTYFHNDESRGRKRYLLSNLFRVIYTTAFDIYALYVNGPAVYPTAMLQQLDLYSTRFSIVAEINVKLLRQGVSYVEIASNRQVGMEGSTSATLSSLMETIRVFVRLIADVYFREPERYAKRPVRQPYTLSLHPINPETHEVPAQANKNRGN